MKPRKNIPASVRERLLSRSRHEERPFNELLQYYAMERFLYRLSQSTYRDKFILKGALMLRVWNMPEIRPTMDIDLLGQTKNEEENIVSILRDVIQTNVEPDGLTFDAQSIVTERITKDAGYLGIRVRFRGTLDTAIINMQVDIGFGDIIHPGPEHSTMPSILDYPVPQLLCYSRESAIAEKCEAMVKLGMLNSRMKDFYDIWLLSRVCEFQAVPLAEALRLTFQRRETLLPDVIVAFEKPFVTSRQDLWRAFVNRIKQYEAPESFEEVTGMMNAFLAPIFHDLAAGTVKPARWPASGPWL